MSVKLREAVFSRWNDAGLDGSIAALYPGVEVAAPEGTALPRVQYSLPTDSEQSRSRGSRELLQPLRFQVWGTDDTTVGQYVDAIEAAYVNSESAQSDPLSIPASIGTVMSVDYVSKAVVHEDDALFQGIVQLEIQWFKPNTG